jgi:hypothetical protein
MAAVSAAEPPALKACEVRYSTADVESPGVRSGLERFYPAGTREYLGARLVFFVVSAPRRSTLSVSGDARFRCTEAGLEMVYFKATQRVVYPRRSSVIRETARSQYFVKPGEAMPREVREGLRSGTVRLNKTL